MKTRPLHLFFLSAIVVGLAFGFADFSYALTGPSPGWQYVRQLTISGSGTPAANYQVKVALSSGQYGSLITADSSALRFYDINSNSCNYWIETWNLGGNSTIWVKVPVINTTTLYMYYGNGSATGGSNGKNTFDFFDDFPGSALGANWTQNNAGGTISVGSSQVTLSNNNGATVSIYSQFTPSPPSSSSFFVEVRHHEGAYNRNRFYVTTSALAGSLAGSPTGFDYGYFLICSSFQIFWGGCSGAVVTAGNDYLTQWQITDGSTYVWNLNNYSYSSGGVGSQVNTQSTTVASTCRYISIEVTEVAGTSTIVDWVRVRQYNSSVPGVSIGNEIHNTLIATIPTHTNVGCNGQSTGTATVSASGGTTPYAYKWSNNQTINSITGLVANTYSVTVSDNNGFASIATVTITQPALPVASNNGPVCAGTPLTLSSNGGTGYSWSGPNSFTSSLQNPTVSPTVTLAAAGTYTVTVTNAAGCTTTYSTTTSVTVNQLPVPVIYAYSPTAFCTGGTLTLNAIGTALSLNGTNQFAATPNLTSYFATTSMTVELWFKATSQGVILDERGQANGAGGWQDSQIEVVGAGPTGTVRVNVWSNTYGATMAISIGTVTYGTWNHAVVRYNGTKLDGFLNGVFSSSSSTYSRDKPAAQYWTIGEGDVTNLGSCPGCGTNYFNGQVDEVRIWNVARLDLQITSAWKTTVPTNSANLVAYYKMDEGSGTSLTDASGNGNTGTLFNAPTWVNPSTVPIYTSYLWSPGGATTSTISVTSSGSYTVTVTDGNGCTASAAQSVTVYPTPQPTINTVCAGNGNVTLTSTAYNAYLWNTGAATQSITVNQAGLYTVTVTDSHGCKGSVSINLGGELVVNGNFSAGNTGFTHDVAYSFYTTTGGLMPGGNYAIGTDAHSYHTLCYGTSQTNPCTGALMFVNGYTGSAGKVFWQETVTVQQNTTYYFSSWTLEANNGTPTAQLQFSINSTLQGSATSLTANALTYTCPTTTPFNWQRIWCTWNSGSNTSATISLVDQNISDGGNDFCVTNISFSTFSPFSISASPANNSPLCAGSTINLSSNVTGGSSPLIYSWAGPGSYSSTVQNPGIPNSSAAMAGTYTVTVTDANNCTTTGTTNVTVNTVSPTPSITGNPGLIICSGNSTTLSTQSYNAYKWSNSTTLQSIGTGTLLSGATYTVTVTGSNGCTTSASTTVTVNAQPAGPTLLAKSPNVGSVCDGQDVTATFNAGTGGVGCSDDYQYSYDGSTWTLYTPGTTVIHTTGQGGKTVTIEGRRANCTSGAGCSGTSYTVLATWVVNALKTISGTFYYYNIGGDIALTAQDITVKLYRTSDNNLMGTTSTDLSGQYAFTNLCPVNDYYFVTTSTHSTAGSVNTTDAAQTNFFAAHQSEIELVRFNAGDVGTTGTPTDLHITSGDAQRIQDHFVNGTAFDNTWTFWKKGDHISTDGPSPSYSSVTLSAGSDLTADMYGLCTGDFNRSFDPRITKSASSTLDLIYSGNRQVSINKEFDLPLNIINASEVGAVSLVLNFPAGLVEVKDVVMHGAGGQLDWVVKGKEMRIGWHSMNPLRFEANAELLTLKLKSTDAFTKGNSVRLSLVQDPLNELADDKYNVIGDAVLSVDVIDAAPVGIEEQTPVNGLTLSNHPNPFNNYTIFEYTLPFEGKVTLEIRNLLGVTEKILVNEMQASGNHSLKFDAGSLPSGIYTATIRLKSASDVLARTIMLVINR